MANTDTIKFLKECDMAVKMGVSSLDEVLDNVTHEKLKKILINSKEQHQQIGEKLKVILSEYDKSGKEPNIMAKSMSWVKTNIHLLMDESDSTVADLVTDGCNMGVKSLSKYINQYKDADKDVLDIARNLINIEERLSVDLRPYL
ncbi:MAG: hypothetical protein J6Y29_04300 [Clostridiales bacterium]|nr:hypothetical protein [Clostridiales bacterium]